MNISEGFNLRAAIKRGIFAVVFIMMALVFASDIKTENGYDYMMMFGVGTFFLGGCFLVYGFLPKTKLINSIDQFANRIHLGVLIFAGLFLSVSFFILRQITQSDSIDWVKMLLAVVFVYVGGKALYDILYQK
ncbi:MAG: hypothetical protein ABFQ53_01290 [Patescibacteria group bacterium]